MAKINQNRKIDGRSPAKRKGNDKCRTSHEYWEKRLQRMGLGVDAGQGVARVNGKPKRWLVYGFDVTKMDFDGRRVYSIQDALEHDEWPMSLYL